MDRETLTYKGFVGALRLDAEEGVLRGRVVNIRDLVTFQGRSVAEVEAEFRESVEDYLEFCASLGEEPDKPFSGRLSLRMKPETHRALSALASRKGRSLNGLVSGILDRAAKKVDPGLRIAPSPTAPPAGPGSTAPADARPAEPALRRGQSASKPASPPGRAKKPGRKRKVDA